MKRAAWLALALVAASCTTNKRLDTVERRLASVEGAQEDTRKDLAGISVRLDAIGHTLEEVKTSSDTSELVAELQQLSARIDEMSKTLAKVQAAPPAPARRPEPDPKDVYAVGVAGAPSEGPADALVTIVRAYDYACPYCEKSRATLAELRTRYPKDLRIVYRSFIVHPAQATLPAEAACAAEQQGMFLDFDARLWSEAFPARQWDQASMEKLAGETGLDLSRFQSDMSGMCVQRIGKDQTELAAVGTGATPTFYINGRYLAGAQPVETFVGIVDEELALAKKRVKAGTKKKKYYDTWVMKKGKTSFVKP